MEQCTRHRQISAPAFTSPLITSESEKHTLNRWQTQLLRNLSVLNLPCLVQRHAPDQLGQIAAAGNGRTTAKRLKLDVADGIAVGVDSDLELHDVATGRRADESSPDVVVVLAHRADVARSFIVVNQCMTC